MIHPLDNLRTDHALVARACAALLGMARAVHAGTGFPAAEAALLLRFLRDFVAAVHLHKEATWLWPAIVMRGSDTEAAAAGEVARLHEEATELIHCLVLFWEPGGLSVPEREGFLATVGALRDRVARMAEIEENTLFPACRAMVPADDLLEWVEQFARVERERGSLATWSRSLAEVLGKWAC
jgi:hemerythrin-like domain-containing protein